MSKCWELQGCPASFYMNCPAFARKVNCWEIANGCYCASSPELECNDCLVYRKYLRLVAKAMKARSQHRVRGEPLPLRP